MRPMVAFLADDEQEFDFHIDTSRSLPKWRVFP
jgi:hypothetical protein